MAVEDFFIQLFFLIAAAVPLAFLIFLNRIPRTWRLVLWLFCSALVLFPAYFLSAMVRYFRTMNWGHLTVGFLEELQQQLMAGSVQEKLLEVPAYAPGIMLSLLAVAAIIAGGVFAWRKIRWYSYLVLFLAFLCIPFAFSALDTFRLRHDIMDHNALRSRTYALIAQKRARNVTGKQMADAIGKTLDGFKFPCRRDDVDRLMNRTEEALNRLTPPDAAGSGGQGVLK